MRARGYVYTYIQLSVARSQVLRAVFLRIQGLTDMWPCVAKSAASSPGKDRTVHGDCLPAYYAGTRFFLNVWRHTKNTASHPRRPKALNKPSRIISRVNVNDIRRFEDCFCLLHQEVEVAKGRYVYVYLKKRQLTWRWRMSSSEIWHGVYSWIIIDISDYPEYGDNNIFRNVCAYLTNDTKSYPRRP
jgi:hypothetical protein